MDEMRQADRHERKDELADKQARRLADRQAGWLVGRLAGRQNGWQSHFLETLSLKLIFTTPTKSESEGVKINLLWPDL
jgi:hypothetical protein